MKLELKPAVASPREAGMTIEADRTNRAHSIAQSHPDGSQIRLLRVIAAVLAILTLALGAALGIVLVGDDDGGAGTAPDDVIQVLDDFATAFDEQDVELMESIITEDFFGTVDFFTPDTAEPAFTVGVSRSVLLREVRNSTFSVERSGDLLVAGDGPWVIAARETWRDPSNLEDGTRIYVIVDDNGAPKLAGYYYVTVKIPVVPEFAD